MSRRRKPINVNDGRWSTPVVGYESWKDMQARTKREELQAKAGGNSDFIFSNTVVSFGTRWTSCGLVPVGPFRAAIK